MKVLFDHQAFSFQRYGGISRFYAELIKHLSDLDGTHIEASIGTSQNEYLYLLDKKPTPLPEGKYWDKIWKNSLPTLNKVHSRSKWKSGTYDLFIPTYFDPYFIKFIKEKPFILTVFDMIHELFPEHYKRDDATIIHKKFLVEKADHIISISQNTKDDLLKIYPEVNPNQVTVIHLASSLQKGNGQSHPDLPTEPYILYVGSRNHYKNWRSFIMACKIVKNNNFTVPIVCVGGGAWKQDEVNLLKSLELLDSTTQISMNDAQLSDAYSRAKMFVFPSLYEGFGIPVLEAMENRCPVVLHNTSSFPEVAGSAGVYPKGMDDTSLAEAMMLLFENEEYRLKVIGLGEIRASQFSWQKTAAQWLEVIQQIV